MNLFYLNDPATTEIYTLSLHDALPICGRVTGWVTGCCMPPPGVVGVASATVVSATTGVRVVPTPVVARSEEHTSELQSHVNLVCRLLLEKKKRPIKIRLQYNERKQLAH